MTIGVTEEHTALAEAISRWTADHAPVSVARAAAEDGGKEPGEVWQALAAQGLLGMHVAEKNGGAGGTYVDAAIAVSELGAVLSGAMVLPTVTVSTLLQLAGAEAARLQPLADGTTTAALTVETRGLTATRDGNALVVSGTVPVVAGAAAADLLLLGANGDDGEVWFVVESSRIEVQQRNSLDDTRPVAAVTLQDVRLTGDA